MPNTALTALVPLLLTAFAPSFDLADDFLDSAVLVTEEPAGLAEPADAVRLREPIGSYTDLLASQAAADGIPPLPEDAVGIGPGSPLLVTIPNEGTFICTANYLFTSGGRTYLGAAGHCFLPESKKATHGTGADYDASGVTVEVCVDFCHFGGQLTGFLGDFVTLDRVAYARQTGPGGDIGNDFGVVEVPASLADQLRPTMPMWGGPTGQKGAEGTGTPVVHYGNGIDAGTAMPSKGRSGTSLNDGLAFSWQANIVINGGDSGSAINHAVLSPSGDILLGTQALGIVTHGIITGVVPLGWGTSIDHAIDMAREAGLGLTLTVEGGSTGGGASSTPVHVHSIDTTQSHFAGGKGHRVETTVNVRDATGAPAAGVSVFVEVTTPQGKQALAGTTDAQGLVTLSAQLSKGEGHGTWTSCVTNLGGSGYTYDSARNLETCQATNVT